MKESRSADKAHIALFVPSLRGGGAERVTVSLANGIATRGIRVDLVVGQADGPYLASIASEVRVVDLGARRVLTSLPSLARYIRRERPAAMVSTMNHANIIAYLAARLSGRRLNLMATEHNTLSKATAKASLKQTIIIALMRLVYPRFDTIVAVSNGVAEDLANQLRLPKSRVYTIYNPIVTDELLSGTLNEEIELPDVGGPLILAVGRLTEQKDYPTLLRALSLLPKHIQANLVILGEGPLRSELEQLASNLDISARVNFLGFSDNPFSWMRAADLFVLSSAWEGLPTVLVEAMACGTPVVSTDCPSGSSEILENGKWGRLVPVGDHDALATAMLNTLSDEVHPPVEDRAAIFSVDRAVDSYLQLLLPGRVSLDESLRG